MPARATRSGTVSGPGEDAAAVPAEVIIMYLAEDHERIAVGLNDVVVRRLPAAGLDLQAALGLIGDHRAAGKIGHAVDGLDQAIRDIRNTIFEHPAPNSHPGSA